MREWRWGNMLAVGFNLIAVAANLLLPSEPILGFLVANCLCLGFSLALAVVGFCEEAWPS